MDFGLQSPFAHHLGPMDFDQELSSAMVTHHDEKIPMPQFYHNQQIQCVNELEWETKSIRNLNNTAPLQYVKMRSLPQSQQASSEVEIFNPLPLDPQFSSGQSIPRRVLLKNASSNLNDSAKMQQKGGSSIHQSSKFDTKKAKYYSEPQSEQNSPFNNKNHQEEEQKVQEQMELKHEDLLKRLAAINDISMGSDDNEKQDQTASQTKEAENPNIETNSISFADIVKAIERVKFVTPAAQMIEEEEEGGGSFQTGQEMQRRSDDWSPASQRGGRQQPGVGFSKPKRAKQKSNMSALDKLNFDGEEIKFD